MYNLIKSAYFLIPGKKYFFVILKKLFTPSIKQAGYLKFKGAFDFYLEDKIKFKIYNDHSTLPTLLFWKGVKGYEQCSLKTWVKLSKKSTVTLDLGANFGLFGLISKAVNPSSEISLFEPLPRNVERVKRNFEVNQQTANIITSAVGDFEGTMTFYDMDSSENTIGSIDRKFVEGHAHATEIIPIEVPITTVDNYVAKEEFKTVDLIKIDVEAADYQVMKGAINTISRFKPNILIEITNNESATQITELLQKLDFQYFIYELNDNEGLKVQPHLNKKGRSRNYLFTKLAPADLMNAYGIDSVKG